MRIVTKHNNYMFIGPSVSRNEEAAVDELASPHKCPSTAVATGKNMEQMPT